MLDNIGCTQTCPDDRELSALEQENRLLRQENEKSRHQTKDVAQANAHTAELMVRLEETNKALSREVQRRRHVEEELRQVNNGMETWIQARTAELTMANERLAREVEERKQVELTLRESEKRVHTVLNAILTGTLIVDRQTREIVDVNPHAAEIIGLPRDRIVGRVCHQFVCPAARSGLSPKSARGMFSSSHFPGGHGRRNRCARLRPRR